MDKETPQDIDRKAIEEHAQRVAEQAALRNVRKTLDNIGESEASERKTLRRVLIVCVLLAAVAAWLFGGMLFGEKGLPKQTPIKVPITLPQKQ